MKKLLIIISIFTLNCATQSSSWKKSTIFTMKSSVESLKYSAQASLDFYKTKCAKLAESCEFDESSCEQFELCKKERNILYNGIILISKRITQLNALYYAYLIKGKKKEAKRVLKQVVILTTSLVKILKMKGILKP